MFISSALFQRYERFVDKSAKVLMAETVALTSDRMFVEIRYKSLYMETYMVKEIISSPIKLFTLAEIFICKQRNNKILTWYGRRNDTFFANRPLTGVTITFIRCLYRVTGVSIGQGDFGVLNYEKQHKEGTCKVLGRSVVFSAFYAAFCFGSKLVIITTLKYHSNTQSNQQSNTLLVEKLSFKTLSTQLKVF